MYKFQFLYCTLIYFSDFCDVGGLSINRGESQKSKQRVFNILRKGNIL